MIMMGANVATTVDEHVQDVRIFAAFNGHEGAVILESGTDLRNKHYIITLKRPDDARVLAVVHEEAFDKTTEDELTDVEIMATCGILRTDKLLFKLTASEFAESGFVKSEIVNQTVPVMLSIQKNWKVNRAGQITWPKFTCDVERDCRERAYEQALYQYASTLVLHMQMIWVEDLGPQEPITSTDFYHFFVCMQQQAGEDSRVEGI
jgi:hypothetical protein